MVAILSKYEGNRQAKNGTMLPHSQGSTLQSGRTIKGEMEPFPWARMMRERFKPPIQFMA